MSTTATLAEIHFWTSSITSQYGSGSELFFSSFLSH